MRRYGTFLLAALALAGVYLATWPVPVDPVAWEAPQDRGLTGAFAANDSLSAAAAIDLGTYEGPEDVAAGPDGALYATTSSGAILRIERDTGTVSEFAHTGGRPLGIEAAADGSLLVANAYSGLQRVSPRGDVTDLLAAVNGERIAYADDLAVSSDGIVFFSDASTKFGARAWNGTFAASLLDILEHGGHGRIVEFDPERGNARVILDGLNFANGVAISGDDRFLLIAETGSYRILRHWLRGPDAGTTEVVVDNLPGFPDNINSGSEGRFWIGLVAPRNTRLDGLSDKPFLRKVVQRLPAFLRPAAAPSSHVIAINGDGDVLSSLQDPQARYPAMTGVCETGRRLYLTRLFGHDLPYVDKSSLPR
ncbi:MAG TPA: SMP-30/gluconolactonase/LRE family protein [Woeseiaceae bacterium]|nr:SMP-30/gluconolactonase/LRE family protein [Woeseiaceae bacterium]